MRTGLGVLFILFAVLLSRSLVFSGEIYPDEYPHNIQADTLASESEINISAELNENTGELKCSGKYSWVNNSAKPIDTIQISLPANKLNPPYIPSEFDEDYFTEIEIKNTETEYLFYIDNDKLSAIIVPNESIQPKSNFNFELRWKIKLPRSSGSIGFADGKNFVFLSDWYPVISTIENGEFQKVFSPNYDGKFLTGHNFNITLKIPAEYKIISNLEIENGQNPYQFYGMNLNEAIICGYKEIVNESDSIIIANKKIRIELYISDYRERYAERYLAAIKNGIKFLSKQIGEFPFDRILLLDVPRNSGIDKHSYPGIITISPELISPFALHIIEEEIFNQLGDQYFQHSLHPDLTKEYWLSAGLSGYIADIMAEEFYPPKNLHFPLISYYPIYGIEFLAYNEIPIIYTLGSYEADILGNSLEQYYQNPSFGTISSVSSLSPDNKFFNCNSVAKPILMMHSLERVSGRQKLLNAIRNYYNCGKNKIVNSNNLISEFVKINNEYIPGIVNGIFSTNDLYDYKISSINESVKGKWEVIAERVYSGKFPSEVILITENDTLRKQWSGEEAWKKFTFETNENVIAAEIDPERKNVFDLNFTNNSLTVKPYYWASLSLSINWFFWIQNALIILGSMG